MSASQRKARPCPTNGRDKSKHQWKVGLILIAKESAASVKEYINKTQAANKKGAVQRVGAL